MTLRTLLHAVALSTLAVLYAVTAWVALHPQVSPLFRDHFVRQATGDWRVTRTAASIADGIDFTQSAYPREVDYVLGLSEVEPTGRWSDARRSPAVSVLLREPISGDQCLDLRFRAASPQVGAPVMVRVGDAAATLVPSDGETHQYSLSLRATKPISSIDIEPGRPSRPLHWGRSGDVRRLAILLGWLRLRPGTCAPD